MAPLLTTTATTKNTSKKPRRNEDCVSLRGRGLLCREAPSLALPPEETCVGGDSGGEAASLREAPLPQTPSPEERLAFGVGRLGLLSSACEVDALSDRLGCGHGG